MAKQDFWMEVRTYEPVDHSKLDPVAYHGMQIHRLRELDRKSRDEDQQMLNVMISWKSALAGSPIFSPEVGWLINWL